MDTRDSGEALDLGEVFYWFQSRWHQPQKCPLYWGPYKPPFEDCAIYSETTVLGSDKLEENHPPTPASPKLSGAAPSLTGWNVRLCPGLWPWPSQPCFTGFRTPGEGPPIPNHWIQLMHFLRVVSAIVSPSGLTTVIYDWPQKCHGVMERASQV